jgi:hypothetical protein
MMKVHVYRVTELYVIEGTPADESAALKEALATVKAGQARRQRPECEFIAIVPGGQETTEPPLPPSPPKLDPEDLYDLP